MKGSRSYLTLVRSICRSFPGTVEKISHGEPTFFIRKGVFVIFANNHHDDGRIAVWIPAPPGAQEALIEAKPRVFFRPPYVGVNGWVGIDLRRVGAKELGFHISSAYEIISSKR